MMLESMINAAIAKKIQTDYPHLLQPLAVRAQITKVSGSGMYDYNLKILDADSRIDERYPEVPGIKSNQAYDQGDTVVVLLLYGQLDLYIIGKAA